MKMRKSLLFLGSVLAIVALLGVTNAFAQLSCTSKSFTTKPVAEGPGVFTVTVDPQTQNGFTTYTYTVTGANASKLFVYVKQGLNADLVSMRDGDPLQPGNYLTPHGDNGGFPPPDAWRVAHHLDGVEFNNIAIAHTFGLRVPERYKPEEGLTTVLLANGSTFEHCGPILGPTTPKAPAFEGLPVITQSYREVQESGCAIILTADTVNNLITGITSDPNTLVPTVYDPTLGSYACAAAVVEEPELCKKELGTESCPPVERGRPPHVITPTPADSSITHTTGYWHCSDPTGRLLVYSSSSATCTKGYAHK